ncbi:MAG: FkbM family methyltransferase [Chloroflexi bacterium]|nr:FkbM family methyltransferase [Chloroflexota bacterium]
MEILQNARGQRLVRRLAAYWTGGRDVQIVSGIGAGLYLNVHGSNPAYALGINELPVQKWLASILEPGDVVYDVGANIGFFTLLAASLVGKAGKVYAFEPVPANAQATRHNVLLNRMAQVEVVETAVSESSGHGELMLAHYSGGSSLAVAGPPPDFKGTLGVDLVSIDDCLFLKKFTPPALVKIDVEGAEINVLRGMVETMREHEPTILYEIDDGDWQQFEAKRQACAAFLAAQNYHITQLADAYPHIAWHVGHFVANPL